MRSAPRMGAARSQTVLDGLHDRLRTKQRNAGLRRRLHVECLGGDNDKIARSDPVRRRRCMNGHRAIAAGAFAAQALGSHRLGVIGPERYGVNLVTGVNHEGGIDRSHGAAADNRNLCHSCSPFKPMPCSPRSRQVPDRIARSCGRRSAAGCHGPLPPVAGATGRQDTSHQRRRQRWWRRRRSVRHP